MNYIKKMRSLIGHETLLTVGCGIIIEANESILLQHRMDEDNWCIPGGVMEIGETFEQAAKRETLEETGLMVHELNLFGIYSGEQCFVEYPNKDKVYSVQVIFITNKFEGNLIHDGIESREHKFFEKKDLPKNINPRQLSFILDWVDGKELPIIH